jgi:hypothetical protein
MCTWEDMMGSWMGVLPPKKSELSVEVSPPL